MTTERHHDRFSPSWHTMATSCPGWLGSKDKSAAAERGDKVHACAESLIKTDHAPENVEAEILLLGMRCYTYWQTLRDQMPGMQWETEPHLPGYREDTSGYADVLGIDSFAEEAVVIDWKPSASEEKKPQGDVLALNVMASRKVQKVNVVFFGYDDESVYTYDVQSGYPESAITEQANSRIERALLLERSGVGYDAVNGKCDWCARSPNCPALVRELRNAPASNLSVESLSPEDLAAALNRYTRPAKYIATIMEKLNQRAKRLLEEGVDVPGYTLQKRSGKRQWTEGSAEKLHDSLSGKVSLTEFVSVAEAEKRMESAGVDTSVLMSMTVQPTYTILKETK